MSAYKTSEKEGPDWRISTRQHEKEEASKQDLDYCKLQAEKNFKYNSTLLLARRQTRTQEIEKKSSKNDWVIETDRGGHMDYFEDGLCYWFETAQNYWCYQQNIGVEASKQICRDFQKIIVRRLK